MSNLLSGMELGWQIQKALGIEHTQRIIIDVPLEGPVVVYVQMIGSRDLLDIDWSKLDGPEITRVEDGARDG